ncbi:hypothetical protein MBLNU459_g7752t1 [Dothideomycetes sp. NU459]
MASTSPEASARASLPSRGSQFIEEDTGAHATAPAGKQSALGVPASEPAVSSSTDLSGATASDPAESIGRGSKRSLRARGREGSNASSKRSQIAAAPLNEKSTRPVSGGTTQSAQPRAKKKSKFLSFLNCCGGPDETADLNPQEPARQSTAAPSAQVASQPSATRTQAANPESTIQGTAGALDEKSASPAYAPNGTNAPLLSEKEKDPMDNLAVDTQATRGVDSLQSGSQNRGEESVAISRGSEAPRLNTSYGAGEGSSQLPNPSVVQAPTPGGGEDEDQIIADRTPEQQARDTDIEMTDVGPSIPLSANDVSGTSEDDSHPVQNREAGHYVDLPPPPPLEERQAQIAPLGAGGAASHDASLVSNPAESQKWLLPAIRPEHKGRKCLVLDLDETLVHSSFKILHQADMTIPVEIEGQYHNVYVIKRPGVDAFMKRVGELYEVVVFTASVSKYGDPLLDQLDIHNVVHHRLFRESCYNHQGNYVKDLSQVGRDLKETIIIDNSPTSYIFHPQHAVPISSWFSDAHDNELLDLIPVLEDLAGPQVSDVSLVLDVGL